MNDGWKILVAALAGILFMACIYVGFKVAEESTHRRRSEQHWADIAACEEADGTVYLKSSGWFAYCELP